MLTPKSTIPNRADARSRHFIPSALSNVPGTVMSAVENASYLSRITLTEAESLLLREELDVLAFRAGTAGDQAKFLTLSGIVQKLDADACVVARCKRADRLDDATYRESRAANG